MGYKKSERYRANNDLRHKLIEKQRHKETRHIKDARDVLNSKFLRNGMLNLCNSRTNLAIIMDAERPWKVYSPKAKYAYKITIRNLSSNVTIRDLSQLFVKHGALLDLYKKRLGIAVVVYGDYISAVRAFHAYNRREFDSKAMHLEVSQLRMTVAGYQEVPITLPTMSISRAFDIEPLENQ